MKLSLRNHFQLLESINVTPGLADMGADITVTQPINSLKNPYSDENIENAIKIHVNQFHMCVICSFRMTVSSSTTAQPH